MLHHKIQRSELARIAAFGIELRSVEEQDLPLMCHWRNQPETLPFMNDLRPVTPKILAFWLNRVRSSDTVWPYIGYMDEEPVGYTELKCIDWFHNCCENGIFLFGKQHFSTGISSRLVLCRELVMARLGLKTLLTRIRLSNVRSIRFCMKYGGEYVRTEGDFHVYIHEFTRRRQCLRTIADGLGMGEEFDRYLGK